MLIFGRTIHGSAATLFLTSSAALAAAGCGSLLGYDDTYETAFPKGDAGGGGTAGNGGTAGVAGAGGASGQTQGGRAGSSLGDSGAGGGSSGAAGVGAGAGASGNAGSGGDGGSAGAAGIAGAAGAVGAGAGGTVGQAGAGAGGTAGQSGAAGDAGQSGAAGNAGQSGAAGGGGSSGQSGAAGGGGSSGTGHPAVKAKYVLACFLQALPEVRPLLFGATLESPADGPSLAISLRLLTTNASKLQDVADGATYNISGSVDQNGAFNAAFLGNIAIPAPGNPYTSSDSELSMPTFQGSLLAPTRICSRLAGTLTKPISFPITGAACVFEAVGEDGTFVSPGNADCEACPPVGPAVSGSKGSPPCSGMAPDLSTTPTLDSGRFTAVLLSSATFCSASAACQSLGKRLAAPNARELASLSTAFRTSAEFGLPGLSLLVGFRQQAGYTQTDSPWCTTTTTPVQLRSYPTTHYVLDDRGKTNTEDGEADCAGLRFSTDTGLALKDVSCSAPQSGFLCETLPK